MSKNLSELLGRKGLNNNLFDRLGTLSKEAGSPNLEDMKKLANEFLIGEANVYGTVSFYDFLKEENASKKVYICNGSACMTSGTQDKLRNELLKTYTADQIGEMSCLGRCHENQAYHLDGKNYSGSENHHHDSYQVNHYGTQILTGSPLNIKTCIERWRSVTAQSPQSVLNEIALSGLKGRGGAGFPISIKLDACRKETSKVKYIVCNADEGDPGAYSDRYLLEQQSFSILLGMMIAGYAAEAHFGVLYIRAEYPESIQIMREKADELMSALQTLPNGDIYPFHFTIIKAKGAYICGEETALINSIEGQRPEVRVRPPYPVQQGLFNKPTVINNVETLANIPWILENGGNKYATIGTSKSTGTKLVSLDSHFKNPGIYEVDMGTSLDYVINTLGDGFKNPIKALQIGGPLGGIIPIHKTYDLTIDFESFSTQGFLLGHASIVSIPENFPMICYLEHLFKFTAHESCGKCFPCRLGSMRGFEMMNRAVEQQKPINRKLLDDLLETMELGSLCALGGGLPLPIKNALQYFESELSTFITKK
ncbi:MAG: NAD(P)H-dependent oxidoreductase subunit E [Flavobacteriales bacterium]|nr:NAD(P)H-dependent oxidoreductase subunit E [Flavobacteriales bacterium]MCZ2442188.1 NAD(P)H-dependent oxidoreductase subunit E [Flavobacteriales bacterium]